METKFTSEKQKELQNKKSMFNFKNVCLMKKQLFSLMMAFALVMGLSVSALAQQGNGEAPSTAYFAVEGASTTHTVTLDGLAGTAVWSVLIVSGDDVNIGEAGASAAAADFLITAGGTATDNFATVQWLRPATAGSIYAVQVEEEGDSDDDCTTIRRSYVSVFGFNVEVALMTADDGTGADNDAAMEWCNTWSGTVIDNVRSAADIADPHADWLNSVIGNQPKVTNTFFRVSISLTGATGGLDLTDIKWRFNYTLQDASNVSIYQVTSHDGALFGAIAGTATIGGDNTTPVDVADGTNGWVYVPAIAAAGSTADYDFTITNNNLLGTIPSEYSIRIDQANLEFDLADTNTDYNNGTKYHINAGAYVAGQPNFGVATIAHTGVQTVNHGPATTVPVIAD